MDIRKKKFVEDKIDFYMLKFKRERSYEQTLKI